MKSVRLLVLTFLALCIPALAHVSADGEHVVRIAMLAPRGSPAFRTLDAWANTLRQRTNGQVRIQYFAGGVSGDERDVIRKMKIGQLDGSGLVPYRPPAVGAREVLPAIQLLDVLASAGGQP